MAKDFIGKQRLENFMTVYHITRNDQKEQVGDTVTQYLVRKIHHTTSEVFLDATRAEENEEFVLVEAESAEEAKEKVKKPKGLLEVVPSSFNNGPISKALNK